MTPKTSIARIESARLNPIPKNPHEVTACAIIDKLKSEGFNFKQIAVDAINRSGGQTPEMYDDTPNTGSADLLESMRVMLMKFAAEIDSRRPLAAHVSHERGMQDDDEGMSPFAQNMVNDFIERQGSDTLDDEDA